MDYSQRSTLYALRFLDHYNRVSPSKIYHISEYKMRYCLYIGSGTWTLHYGNSSHREELVPDANSAAFNAPEKASNVQDNVDDNDCEKHFTWGGPTLFLSVDFVNILPKNGVDRH